ncbi:MAG: hypothetical protein EB060_11430 [Proteobacteria bacterium]|nr:hypothetical protein [Pseudomonadota bacterium]NDF13408.1 hypothetical protein [Pseudomonadota bacterium]
MEVFDKALLTFANQMAIKLGYNRAIEPEYLKNTPDDQHWAVVFCMLHEHKAGKPTDPHVRCMLRPLVKQEAGGYKVDPAVSLMVDVVPEIFERAMIAERQPATPKA